MNNRQQIEETLVTKALQDDAFRQQLLSNPNSALEAELGQPLPGGIQLRVVEETPDTLYLVLPTKVASSEELSEEALESVAGGAVFVIGTENGW